jgi:2-dehydropantoate 2-reductase
LLPRQYDKDGRRRTPLGLAARRNPVRIAVIGVGSIGGLLAASLARAGEDVSVVARGAHLQAIRANGLKLVDATGEFTAQIAATDRIADLPPQDCVVIGVKSHQVADVADDMPALLGAETTILTAQNGVPWWYFEKHGGAHDGRRLESVDPGGHIARALPIERVIGSVVYQAAEIVAPGVIRHIEGHRFTLGEIDGAATPRVKALSQTFERAGFKSPVVSDIRSEIWLKLLGNATLNPVSALTRATLEDICRFPLSRELIAGMMTEVRSVAEALGVRLRLSIEKRIAGAEAVGAHKTSMLQDIEAGRALEIDALLGAVLELAAIVGLEVPRLAAVYALVKLLTARDRR